MLNPTKLHRLILHPCHPKTSTALQRFSSSLGLQDNCCGEVKPFTNMLMMQTESTVLMSFNEPGAALCRCMRIVSQIPKPHLDLRINVREYMKSTMFIHS